MQCNTIQHNTIMCYFCCNISWTFHELLLLWQEITLPSGHNRRRREQDQRKSSTCRIQDMAALWFMMFATAEHQVKQHMFELQHGHSSCFTSQQSDIQPWHSTQTMQTQRSPLTPAASMMDELSDKGLHCIFNSTPQGHCTLQLLLWRWPWKIIPSCFQWGWKYWWVILYSTPLTLVILPQC